MNKRPAFIRHPDALCYVRRLDRPIHQDLSPSLAMRVSSFLFSSSSRSSGFSFLSFICLRASCVYGRTSGGPDWVHPWTFRQEQQQTGHRDDEFSLSLSFVYCPQSSCHPHNQKLRVYCQPNKQGALASTIYSGHVRANAVFEVNSGSCAATVDPRFPISSAVAPPRSQFPFDLWVAFHYV